MELDYRYAYDTALTALLDMKGYMEYLRDNNPESYEKRAHWITDLWNFLKASEDMIQNMHEALDTQYKRGVEVGKGISVEYDFQHKMGQWFNKHSLYKCTDTNLHQFVQKYQLTTSQVKEQLRKQSIDQLKQDCPELF